MGLAIRAVRRDRRGMNGRRVFVIVAVGLAIVAALLRVHPSAEAHRESAAVTPAGRANAVGQIVVYVAGEVSRPGVYRLPAGTRADAAVRRAGGMTPRADPIGVNLAESLRDGEEIVVPAQGASPTVASKGTGTHRKRPRRRANVASLRRIDLNRASADELETLPGIGPRLAERIVAFRATNGPFGALDELLDVNGVSDKLLAAIEQYVALSH
jgi:competence protein ComEA